VLIGKNRGIHNTGFQKIYCANFLSEPLQIIWSIVNHYCEFLIGHTLIWPIIYEVFWL